MAYNMGAMLESAGHALPSWQRVNIKQLTHFSPSPLRGAHP